MHPAGRALVGLWAGLALLAGGGAVVLWRLGPPPGAGTAAAPRHEADRAPPTGSGAEPGVSHPAATASGGGAGSGTTRTDIAVSPPLPALAEPAPDFPGRTLPIVAADGRTSATIYAARAGLPATGPQVAILLEGFGLSDTLDHEAMDSLPPAVSFAVSPYADGLDRPGNTPLLDAARHDGHELWLSLPMEPAGSPTDSEGTRALSLDLDLAQDRTALLWSLSRFPGYVGLTNALGGLRGDRFASSRAFAMVADELKRRGLAYVDAGLAPHDQPAIDPAGTRHADLTLDESPNAADIQARLSRLEQLAQSNGSALGIAGPLRPVTLERIRSWSRALRERGIALVPVSALPPPHPPVRDLPRDTSDGSGATATAAVQTPPGAVRTDAASPPAAPPVPLPSSDARPK